MYTEKDTCRKVKQKMLKQHNMNKSTDKIYIRADMNEIIATGHIMRCLSIADAAREMGKETEFITADEKPVDILQKRGYEPVILHTDWQRMEDELEVLIPLIQECFAATRAAAQTFPGMHRAHPDKYLRNRESQKRIRRF